MGLGYNSVIVFTVTNVCLLLVNLSPSFLCVSLTSPLGEALYSISSLHGGGSNIERGREKRDRGRERKREEKGGGKWPESQSSLLCPQGSLCRASIATSVRHEEATRRCTFGSQCLAYTSYI